MATWKQRFNKKYGFSKDESHSIAEIARLTGYKYRNLLKIREKGLGLSTITHRQYDPP